MAKKKTKKQVRKHKPVPAKKTQTGTRRSRHTQKTTAMEAFAKEYKTNVGMDLSSDDRTAVGGMTVQQIEKVSIMLRLSWTKGYRTGSYHDSKRR